VSTPASATTSTTQPAAGWVAVGSATVTPGADSSSFTVSGGDTASTSGVFLRLPADRCDYVVSVEGRLVTGDAAGFGLRARSLPTGDGPAVHSLRYDSKVGYRDSGDAVTRVPADIYAPPGEWHQLAIEVKGDVFTVSGDGQAIAQGEAIRGCGGVFLDVWSPGQVEFRNFTLSDPPVPFVDGHPCPTLRAVTVGPLMLCDEGPLVREVQAALVGVGENVTVDGQFGPGTQAALRHFQIESGHPPTGLTNDTGTMVALGLVFDD
jgi:hypothetical protein